MEQKSRSKSVVATISALAVAATIIGGGLAWFTIHQNNRPQVSTPNKVNSPNPVTVDPVRVEPPQVAPITTAPNPTAVVPSVKPTSPRYASIDRSLV